MEDSSGLSTSLARDGHWDTNMSVSPLPALSVECAVVLWWLEQRVEEGAEQRGPWHHHWCEGSVCWASLPASVTRGHCCSSISPEFLEGQLGWRSELARQRENQMGRDERTVSVRVLLHHYRIIPLNPHSCPWGGMRWSRLEMRNKGLEVWVTASGRGE